MASYRSQTSCCVLQREWFCLIFPNSHVGFHGDPCQPTHPGVCGVRWMAAVGGQWSKIRMPWATLASVIQLVNVLFENIANIARCDLLFSHKCVQIKKIFFKPKHGEVLNVVAGRWLVLTERVGLTAGGRRFQSVLIVSPLCHIEIVCFFQPHYKQTTLTAQ